MEASAEACRGAGRRRPSRFRRRV